MHHFDCQSLKFYYSTNVSQRLTSSPPYSLLFDMTPVSGCAQVQTALSLICHSGEVFLRDAGYGRSDGFRELFQVLWAVFKENFLDVPQRRKAGGVESGECGP